MLTFVKNSVPYFSAWIFPPLEVVLVFRRLWHQRLVFCSVLEVSTLGGGAGGFVVVDVDVVVSAGGGGFWPRSSSL